MEGISVMRSFIKAFNENSIIIKEKFKHNIILIDKVFDNEIQLFELIGWTLKPEIQATNVVTPVAFSGFYKSLLSIYGAYDLTIKGQYGSARILLRHAFEYLLTAKYCSLSKNDLLIKKWEIGDDISLNRDVISKLVTPLPKRFREFWKLLCQFTHASIYSQQVEVDAEKNEREINVNFSFIRALLEMNYHLFNRHMITSSMEFYFDSYGKEDEIVSFKQRKLEMRKLFSISKQLMSQETKGIVKDYTSTWKLKV